MGLIISRQKAEILQSAVDKGNLLLSTLKNAG